MSEQPETPPQAAEAESLNGQAPAPETAPAENLATVIAREVNLTWRATEEIDMRLQVIQIELALVVGLTLLMVALHTWRGRKAAE